MRHHLNVRLIETTEFTQADVRQSNFVPNAINGTIQPIDKILIYNDNEMVGNILNERMRFDFFTLLPELSSNNLRNYYNDHGFVIIPDGYCRNVKSNNSQFKLYSRRSIGTGMYFMDDLNPFGFFDFSFRLPPVPARTYEIRISCHIQNHYSDDELMVQVYIDNKVCGLPINYMINGFKGDHVGWIDDADTYDNGVEFDKHFRNRG
jgi:hypothetical protein